ncbi:Uncharacterised protein [[Eubacterium] contortum]|uniref:Transposase n=1 Tax=Faecalicatena contorta TaxID=39482 RepID=A0A174HVT3_9FIRM|nr:Uncharacterised protein [[Eubacterium] contortum] [Faecalicatena contorta]
MDNITHQIRAEHWTKIMNECINSGMPKTAWCRVNGFSEKQFFYWQRSPAKGNVYYGENGFFRIFWYLYTRTIHKLCF